MDCRDVKPLKPKDEVSHGCVFLCADPERIGGSATPCLEDKDGRRGLSGAGGADDPMDLSLQSSRSGVKLRVGKRFSIGTGDLANYHRRGGIIGFDRRGEEGETL